MDRSTALASGHAGGRAHPVRAEVAQLLKLSGPVVLSRLGIMAMGLSDAIVVGRYSATQLGYHALPVGLLNAAGYYDHLIAFVATMAEVGFLRPQHRELLIVGDTLGGLLDKMAAHRPLEATITLAPGC